VRGARVVLLAGTVVLVALVVFVASQRGPRLVGSNRVAAASFPVVLRAQRTACQAAQIPAAAGDVRVLVGTYGRPRPPISLSLDGRAAGRVGSGAQGWVRIPLLKTLPRAAGRLCLTVAGRYRVALAGAATKHRVAARTRRGRALPGLVRLEYETGVSESWWSTLGPATRRFARGKADWVGPWTLGLVGLFALGSLAAAGWALARRVPE
jgi:hypothetical protein